MPGSWLEIQFSNTTVLAREPGAIQCAVAVVPHLDVVAYLSTVTEGSSRLAGHVQVRVIAKCLWCGVVVRVRLQTGKIHRRSLRDTGARTNARDGKSKGKSGKHGQLLR